LALPEVVIALLHDRQIEQPLRRFSLQLAIVTTLLLALLVFTPLIDGYLFGVQDTTTEVGNLARSGLGFFVLLPGLTVLISWVRGLLITRRATRDINVGMVVNMLVTALILFLGIREQWPGINTAALALSAASAAEFLYIWWRAGNIFSSIIALEETSEPLVSG